MVFFPALFIGTVALVSGQGILTALAGYSGGAGEYFQINPPEASQEEGNEAETFFMPDKKDAPVEFLDEILPASTPDPNRVSYKVEEIDGSGSKGAAGISVNDTSDSGLNLAEEIKKEFSLEKSDGPLVLIYHTHTCESYLKYDTGFYYGDESFRSTEPAQNINRVGEALKESLELNGISAIHDTTIHDSPAFNGAYSRSEDTVKKYLEQYPSIKITIDLHRDAMINDEGTSYKPVAEVDGKKAAQMMIIAGCDPTGELEYDNWYPNLIFALKLQQKGEALYGPLMRPLMFCQRSYNMWLTDSSFLVEIGTQANTFSEAEYSGKLLGNLLAQVINEAPAPAEEPPAEEPPAEEPQDAQSAEEPPASEGDDTPSEEPSPEE